MIFRYLNDRSSSTRIPNTMTYNDVIFDSPNSIVDAFADRFSSIFSASSAFPLDFAKDNSVPLSLSYATEEDLLQLMSKFANVHTSGDDLIPSFVVRNARYALAKPLAFIINLSIKTAVFPSLWQRARVIPVFKKGANNCVDNYRPMYINTF
ncbi:retrovirus-related pol polyprotein from type-1 retrotransposable element r1-like protein [Holotrichia oblita]|uniref:Retrovirus-related pol polyprotein from type-1 retrotransposable element r1-like protein n=1 Tax=Holotrichia oblita TaxID=644536 RepID=A0ACB9TFK4_HOLOL|nr:retrovirus-related pol polyprotein from type-1 retrotransposable element r1-like protein [Holotrichia oblita]